MFKWHGLLAVSLIVLSVSCQKDYDFSQPEVKVNLPSESVLHMISATADLPYEAPQTVEARNDLSIIDYFEFKPEFSVFLQAINRLPGLALVLDNPLIQVTVFAPENDAFNAFLSANGFASVDEVPLDVLNQLLSYHVLLGRMDIDWFKSYMGTLAYADCENGGRLDIYAEVIDPRNAVLNGFVNITRGNLFVGRSFVHVIDQVLPLPMLPDFITLDPNFSMLVDALVRVDLSTDFIIALLAEGPFTVFAPTNEAFQALLDTNPDWNSVSDIPADVLETVLSYHVVPDQNLALQALSAGRTMETLATDGMGNALTLSSSVTETSIQITGGSSTAIILDGIRAEIQSNNGVIHAIDTVLLP